MRIALLCLMFFGLAFAAAPPKKNDWAVAREHARSGQTVRLTLKGLSSNGSKQYSVYIGDGRHESHVGAIAFYVRDPANFALDLSPALRKNVYREPSIWLVDGNKQFALKPQQYEVELIKRKVQP